MWRLASRLVAIQGFLGVAAICFGGVVFSIPANSTHPMPNYFSGTNARISAHAHLTAGTVAMTEAILFIGGIESYHGYREYIPGDPVPANWNVHIMFDSTQFASPGNLTIEFRVKDETGVWHSYQTFAPNKNKGAFYEHPDPSFSPDGAPTASAIAGAMGYQTVLQNGGTWSAASYFANNTGSNIGFVVSHGNPDFHESGAIEAIRHGAIGGSINYESERQAIVGSGVETSLQQYWQSANELPASLCL